MRLLADSTTRHGGRVGRDASLGHGVIVRWTDSMTLDIEKKECHNGSLAVQQLGYTRRCNMCITQLLQHAHLTLVAKCAPHNCCNMHTFVANGRALMYSHHSSATDRPMHMPMPMAMHMHAHMNMHMSMHTAGGTP